VYASVPSDSREEADVALTGPTFIGIGPMKSGSTSLYFYLRQHPEIYLSPLKAPKYFEADWDANPRLRKRSYTFEDHLAGRVPRDARVTSLEEYRRFYAGAGDARAAGEVCPSYLTHRGVAERIREFDPAMKLVAILRDPVARAYSHYNFLVMKGQESSRSFLEAVAREDVDEPLFYDERFFEKTRPRSYLRQGFYAKSLAAYRKCFPEEQIKVLLFEDLKERPQEMLADVFAFLGVDPEFRPDDLEKHNPTRAVKSGLVQRFLGRVPGGATARRILPRKATEWFQRTRNRVRNLNLGTPEPLSPEDRAALLPVFREDTLALAEMLGRDLSEWLE
jgi:hypothetical protein